MLPGRLSATRWLAIVVLLAAALRLCPVWFGLPYPHARPDEAVALGHAVDILNGDLNPHFFHWPSLTFYVFAGVLAVASAIRRLIWPDPTLPPGIALIIARSCVAIAGTLTVVVLFRLGRRIAGDTTGLLAAAFLSVAILHVRDSHFAMTDVLMTLLVTSSVALLVRGIDIGRTQPSPASRSTRIFATAGALGGLAASTKYNAAAILGAAAAAQILWVWDNRHAWRSPRTWVPGAAFSIAFAAGFLAATPYAVLDFETFAADLRFDFTHLSGGHGIILGRGWSYHLMRSLPYGTGVLTFIAAVAGTVPFVRHHPRQAFVIASFCGVFYAAIGSGYTVFFRYVLPLVPVVCLSAAVAVRHGGAWLAPRMHLSEGAAVSLLAAIVWIPSFVNSAWFDLLLARTDTRVIAGRWLAPRLEPGETVHDAGGDYTRLELGRTPFHYWHFDPDTSSFGHPQGHTPDWIVLTQSPLRTYASASAPLRRLANERYDLVFSVTGTRGGARSAVYDLQDAFFMPLSGFHTVERPGPTILIYRRKD
jgi:hypothetical protein